MIRCNQCRMFSPVTLDIQGVLKIVDKSEIALCFVMAWMYHNIIFPYRVKT